MNKVTLLAIEGLLPAEMGMLEDQFNVIKLWREKDPESALHRYAHDARAILSCPGPFRISAKLMDALPNLEIVAQNGVGFDNIDVIEAKKRQIAVVNTPDLVTHDTADTALALMINVMRRVVEGDMFIRTGQWLNGALPLSASLTGKTVGIVGLGRIGAAIARRCAAFDMTVVYHGRTAKSDVPYKFYANLLDMAAAVDVLMVATPGGDGTRHLISRAVMSAMKPTAYLVNISRGSVVDQDALVELLVNGKIAGAGLDVFQQEPQVPEEFKSMDNVVMTPHIGAATVETRTRMGQLILANLAAHFEGRPLLTPVAA